MSVRARARACVRVRITARTFCGASAARSSCSMSSASLPLRGCLVFEHLRVEVDLLVMPVHPGEHLANHLGLHEEVRLVEVVQDEVQLIVQDEKELAGALVATTIESGALIHGHIEVHDCSAVPGDHCSGCHVHHVQQRRSPSNLAIEIVGRIARTARTEQQMGWRKADHSERAAGCA